MPLQSNRDNFLQKSYKTETVTGCLRHYAILCKNFLIKQEIPKVPISSKHAFCSEKTTTMTKSIFQVNAHAIMTVNTNLAD